MVADCNCTSPLRAGIIGGNAVGDSSVAGAAGAAGNCNPIIIAYRCPGAGGRSGYYTNSLIAGSASWM